MSDTHGRVDRAEAALETFAAQGVQALVHCGDIGAEGVLDALAGWQAWLVWGNTDAWDPHVRNYARSLGFEVADAAPLFVEVGGSRFALGHGHEPGWRRLVEAHDNGGVPQRERADYLFQGHTHVPCDVRLASGARLINPGALYRAQPPTVATLELATGDATFWHLHDGGQRASVYRPLAPRTRV